MLRYFPAMLWFGALCMFIGTNNLDALLRLHVVHFHMNPHPHLSDLLIVRDAHPFDPFWLMVKTGHFAGFVVLELLLAEAVGSRGKAVWIAVLAAAGTEVLQLFLMRDGRLLDIAIDGAGVMTAYLMRCAIYRITPENGRGQGS